MADVPNISRAVNNNLAVITAVPLFFFITKVALKAAKALLFRPEFRSVGGETQCITLIPLISNEKRARSQPRTLV
jgi:hypothetical protein